MNVQQINDTGHNMWAFIFTSIVLLTISRAQLLIPAFYEASYGAVEVWL
jgi:hypothetical protein